MNIWILRMIEKAGEHESDSELEKRFNEYLRKN